MTIFNLSTAYSHKNLFHYFEAYLMTKLTFRVRYVPIWFSIPSSLLFARDLKIVTNSLHDMASHWLHGNSILKIWLRLSSAWTNSPS
jgi:hypothetical protein